MKSELNKKTYVDPGSRGLPAGYPVPPADDDLLFYIQRNLNHDTIVYELNRTPDGLINQHMPMHAYWIKYTRGGIHKELNKIQSELAYGYRSQDISEELYSFKFVSYADLTFYIAKDGDKYRVHTEVNGRKMVVDHIYVYAQEFGVFPDVKFVEFYGVDATEGYDIYERIVM